MKKGAGKTTGAAVLVVFLVFLMLFTYSSLNLKNIDFGYKMQNLQQKVQALNIEVDKLRAKRAFLLNLERIDRIARSRFGYRSPEPAQVYKFFRKEK